MNSGKMVFSQIMDCLPWWRFHSIVKQYRGNHKSKHFSCAEHFRVMAFAQLTHRKSLRDVEAAFDAIGKKAYHMGIKCKIAKSTLADANEQRNWKIYADFSQVLIAQARKLYAEEPLDVQWDGEVYAIDATTIDLCLSVYKSSHQIAHENEPTWQYTGVYPYFRWQAQCCKCFGFDRSRAGCFLFV